MASPSSSQLTQLPLSPPSSSLVSSITRSALTNLELTLLTHHLCLQPSAFQITPCHFPKHMGLPPPLTDSAKPFLKALMKYECNIPLSQYAEDECLYLPLTKDRFYRLGRTGREVVRALCDRNEMREQAVNIEVKALQGPEACPGPIAPDSADCCDETYGIPESGKRIIPIRAADGTLVNAVRTAAPPLSAVTRLLTPGAAAGKTPSPLPIMNPHEEESVPVSSGSNIDPGKKPMQLRVDPTAEAFVPRSSAKPMAGMKTSPRAREREDRTTATLYYANPYSLREFLAPRASPIAPPSTSPPPQQVPDPGPETILVPASINTTHTGSFALPLAFPAPNPVQANDATSSRSQAHSPRSSWNSHPSPSPSPITSYSTNPKPGPSAWFSVGPLTSPCESCLVPATYSPPQEHGEWFPEMLREGEVVLQTRVSEEEGFQEIRRICWFCLQEEVEERRPWTGKGEPDCDFGKWEDSHGYELRGILKQLGYVVGNEKTSAL